MAATTDELIAELRTLEQKLQVLLRNPERRRIHEVYVDLHRLIERLEGTA